jgi:hypothetical protein
LVTKIKAKLRAKMQAEIARRLNKAGGGAGHKPGEPNKAGGARKKPDRKDPPRPLPSVPQGNPAVPVPANVDVELVTVPTAGQGMRLSRRDMVLCGIGILAGAAAAAAGFLLAYRTR